jgi:hypothetical protein
MHQLGVEGEEVARVWLNFLPTQIWAYRRAGAHPSAKTGDFHAA